jgi:putative component of membrane protein insertase Oxa1/YidC/SpoIIIJ protein YidD
MEWGFFIGIGLTLWRILRCNPFSAGGYDPVPERRPRKGKGEDKQPNKDEK